MPMFNRKYIFMVDFPIVMLVFRGVIHTCHGQVWLVFGEWSIHPFILIMGIINKKNLRNWVDDHSLLYIWMFPKNRGSLPPKWMVKTMENPYEQMDDLGGTPIFGNTHMETMGV